MTPKGTRVKYPLIVAASRALGVSRPTLFRALTGSWSNPDLVARYRDFVTARITAAAPNTAAPAAPSSHP